MLEAKTTSIVELEGSIKVLQDNMKTLDTTKKKRKRKLKDKLAKLKNALELEMRSRMFKIEPQNFSPIVTMKPHHMTSANVKFWCRMTQIPVNVNDATTGHKLQGMSKDVLIVTSWPFGGLFKNWEYVVLSRVRTLSGLYLFEPIDLKKSFKPTDELRRYLRRARYKEKIFLDRRIKNMADLGLADLSVDYL